MNKNVKEILGKIINSGYEAYLVGGYPRDLYLGRKSEDYDITTNALPEEIKTIFKETKDQDTQYGNITLEIENGTVQITTYRKESEYHNHRHPSSITYVKELKEDLYRRDFIMNTLCMNEKEEFIDLLGAKKDIDQKLIRVVGDTSEKIKQDSLRILRAIRFASTLNFKLDPELKKAILEYKDQIKELSYFRKKEELNRIFTSEYAPYGISLLQEFHLEEPLELSNLDTLNLNAPLLGIWAQLTFSSKYEFSKKERKEIETIRTLLEEDILNPFVLYTYGHYYCGLVGEIKGISRNLVLEHYRKLPIHHKDEIAITKKELEQIAPKQLINSIYEDLETQILNGELDNFKVLLRKYVIKKYSGRN